MEKRKIYQWLQRLKGEELDLFMEYLRSPLHSNRPQLAGMMGHLIPHLTEEQPESLSNETYWELVYPGKPYNANLLNRLLSEMASELKGYIQLSHFKNDLVGQRISLLRAYRERGWDDVIPKEISTTRKKFSDQLPRDEYFLQAQLEISVEEMLFNTKNLGRDPGPIFQDCIQDLESYFVLNLLKLNLYSKNHDQLHRTNHMIRFSEQLWPQFEEGNFPNAEMIKIYWLIDQFLSHNENLEFFTQYVNELISIAPDYLHTSPPYKIGKQECEDLFVAGLNYCIEGLNIGRRELVPIYLLLINKGMEKGAFLSSGNISMDFFTSMVIPMLRVKQYDLAEEFVDEHQMSIQDHEREFSVLFLKGTIDYMRREFERAKKAFLTLKYQFPSPPSIGANINSRQLLCRIYFEQQDYESFYHEANALNTFIKRNKFYGRDRAQRYQNFVKYAKRLERILNGIPGQRLEGLQKLQQDIKGLRVIIAKDWFLEKIENEIRLTE